MKKYLGVLCAVLLTLACLVVPASAVDYPAFDVSFMESISDSYKLSYDSWQYSICQNRYGYFCLVYPTNSVSLKFSSGIQQLDIRNISDSTIPVFRFKHDGSAWSTSLSDSWPEVGSGSYAQVSSLGGDITFFESAVDVYATNGDIFFQKPLPWEVQTLEAVTGQAPALVTAKLKTTLDCLVPLGIGLMALFVGLLLLRKVFYRFRVKS